MQNVSSYELNPVHRQELKNSAIANDIIDLNFRTVDGEDVYELLLPYSISRRNDGRLRDADLARYSQIADNGGWWCSGIDPLNNYLPMEWGCLKPTTPIKFSNGKTLKYEHPKNQATRAFFLRISGSRWEAIAIKYNTPIHEDDRCMGFWYWVYKNNVPITITEGAKKAACLLSQNIIAIGLPGINSGYRRVCDDKALTADIQHFTNGREFNICFDQDVKPKTVIAVNGAIKSMAFLLIAAKSTVKVVLWSENYKGIDDVVAWYQIFHVGEKKAQEIISNAILFTVWQVRDFNDFSFAPNIPLNQRYVGSLNIPSNEKFIALKSPKGTGKTESFIEIVREHINNGYPVLLISHRIQLAKMLGNRLGIPYIEGWKDSDTGKLFGYGLCIDSLHSKGKARFKADTWDNALVIIDECEQVLWHLLTSTTDIKNNRCEVLEQLGKLLAKTLQSEHGKVIVADADLTNLTIDFVQGVSGIDVKPYIIANSWKGTPYNVLNYCDTDKIAFLAAMVKDIHDGGRQYICLDGQKTSSTWGTRTIERYLKGKCKGKRILRIDSHSLSDPKHPAFRCIDSINEVVKDYDIVIASPSVGTGISIDITGHFTSVWGLFQGVVSEQSARQAIARVREPIDRHIFVSEAGLNGSYVGGMTTGVGAIIKNQKIQFEATINKLHFMGMLTSDVGIRTNDKALQSYAQMTCRHNAGLMTYRYSVISALIGEGHTITDVVDGDKPDGMKQEFKQCKEDLYTEETELIAASDISGMTYEQYKELSQSKVKTEEELHKEQRYKIELSYGIPCTPDLVRKNDDNWYRQLELHYLLTVGREHLSMKDKKHIDVLLETKTAWLPTFNGSQFTQKIALLDAMGITALLTQSEIRVTDCKTAFDIATNYKSDVKAILGVTTTGKDTPIKFMKRILTKLGLKLPSIGRDGGGKRLEIFSIVGSDDGRDEVFRVWLDRDARKLTDGEIFVSGRYNPSLKPYIFNKEELPVSDGISVSDGSESSNIPDVVSVGDVVELTEYRDGLNVGSRHEVTGIATDCITIEPRCRKGKLQGVKYIPNGCYRVVNE